MRGVGLISVLFIAENSAAKRGLEMTFDRQGRRVLSAFSCFGGAIFFTLCPESSPKSYI